MIRLETETGWWLITHPDHARLAGAFATHWGNDLFAKPEPREHVLLGIHVHDDGWALRDATPSITRQGIPSAFSSELVGKYSAFEEIDLADYLAVRERAVQQIATQDPYAAILISLHTENLLTDRADRSTIAAQQLPLLDDFLLRQQHLQQTLRKTLTVTDTALEDNFRLLQATDNLSLLACVDYAAPATLLHPLCKTDGTRSEIQVTPRGNRTFRLDPYPFAEPTLTLTFPARHVTGKTFSTSAALQAQFTQSPLEELSVTLLS